MQQTPEAEAFLERIIALPTGPGVSLNDALQPSLEDEAELRKLFATDKTNARLDDPFVGLVDVFAAPEDIRTTRARVVADDKALSEKYVMPLSTTNRRHEGTPCIVNELEEFKKNWSVFTEGSLSQLFDWSNVVAAGGAVLACLTPLSDTAKESKRSMRKYYHSAAYPSSDVDLFLWGMDAAQAEKKINVIYEAVRDSVPWDVTCVRTKHAISIHSQYPYRSIQIVLRLYRSPAEIMAGFDIDAPCCFYNGERVYANPRAIVAMMRQCNTVDMTRRSPSYEVRLAKYSGRGFEVYVPTLERENIDPTIYERSIARIEGLARLLVLEKLTNTDVRYAFLESRRTLRGRPNPLSQYRRRRRRHNGDLKADTSIGGLEMNDYDVASLHIPYGPGWDARRIDKLVYQTDLGMNSTFNPKNKGRRLHRHPAFFGTMVECLEDCCEHCPSPIDADERQLLEEEDKHYIRGRVAFIEEDPGRQSMSGSFNPIDVGEWSGQVYIGETEHFFAAIAAHDEEGVTRLLEKGVDVHRRDHVGRTPLHVAILCKAGSIACTLIDAGARMTARLVDGRTCLHLAAQLDLPIVIRKLLERSAINQEQVNMGKQDDQDDVKIGGTEARDRLSSEDDWSSEDDVISMDSADDGDDDDEGESDDDVKNKKVQPSKDTKATTTTETARDPENFLEEEDEPDILDVNLPDWDLGFTPLAHAVLSGSLKVVEILLTGGADPKLVNTNRGSGFHSLTLTILRKDEEEASKILERLILAGASTSTADDQMRTIFHRALIEDKLELVSTMLRCDPNAKTVLDFPSFVWQNIFFPLTSAIRRSRYAIIALMLAHGASVAFTEEHVTRVLEIVPIDKRRYFMGYSPSPDILSKIFHPVETAIASRDDVAQLLINIGADVNVGCKKAHGNTGARSVVDWVKFAIKALDDKIYAKRSELGYLLSQAATTETTDAVVADDEIPKTWKAQLAQDEAKLARLTPFVKKNSAETALKLIQDEITAFEEVRAYMQEVRAPLIARGAKSWNEIYPGGLGIGDGIAYPITYAPPAKTEPAPRSYSLLATYGSQNVPQHQIAAYDELFEACFRGDNDKIQEICLPVEGRHNNPHPLQIQVQVANASKTNMFQQTGYTPLYAALSGRRWETAKLIMAIAAAQYCPPKTETKFSTGGITLDNDSDSDSDSGESDVTVEPTEPTFIDVAHRPSSIRTDVHPSRLLDVSGVQLTVKQDNGTYMTAYANAITKAIYEDDFVAFVNILNLYRTSPIPITLPMTPLDVILTKDRVEMLDEFIRRTGAGLDIAQVQKGVAGAGGEGKGESVFPTNDATRLYLGLNVHGKKRTDLAKRNDPNALPPTPYTYPLLWRAAFARAKAIVTYLAGDRPLAAYQFYAASGTGEGALLLARMNNLAGVLKEWLGWKVTKLGESPLSAAIMGGDLEVVKLLFEKDKRLMKGALHEKIKFIGYNALMIAIDTGVESAMVDFLLAKSVSPAEVDQVHGWNIYHMLCRKNHCDLLDHLLKKLPRDVSEALLAQQCKNSLDTPLHLAVNVGAIRATQLITAFTTTTLLLRNTDGSTPLHLAVQCGFATISRILLSASPAAAYMENGVGETPLETITRRDISERTQTFASQHANEEPPTLDMHNIPSNPRPMGDVKVLEGEIPKLQTVIERMREEGRLVQGTKLDEELGKWVKKLEGRLVEAKVRAEREQKEKPSVVVVEIKNPIDTTNVRRTLEAAVETITQSPGHRELVHLVDVQRSVQRGLDQVTPSDPGRKVERDDGEGLAREDDGEVVERRESMVLQRIQGGPKDITMGGLRYLGGGRMLPGSLFM